MRAAALAALLLGAPLGAQGPAAAPALPTLAAAAVGRDTAWFYAAGGPAARGEVAYACPRGGPCVRRAPASRAGAARLPASERDTVPLGRGLALVRLSGNGAPLAIYARAGRRVYPLHAAVDGTRRRRLAHAAGWMTDDGDPSVPPPPLATRVSAWVADTGGVWLGLDGGFVEGEGAVGGLLHFDARRRRVEAVLDSALANAVVTGLAVADGALWVGTREPEQDGSTSTVGLVRLGLHDRAWRRYATRTGAPLPDDEIRALATDGRVLAIGTASGVATYEPATGRWSTRWFAARRSGDTLVHELVAARP